MEEIKLCPFCGSEADLRVSRGKKGYFTYCKCSFCGAQARTYSLGESCQDDPQNAVAAQRSVAAWNMRFVDDL